MNILAEMSKTKPLMPVRIISNNVPVKYPNNRHIVRRVHLRGRVTRSQTEEGTCGALHARAEAVQ